MIIRGISVDDLDELIDCWNESVRFDPATPGLMTEKIWADPDFDADLALAAVDAGRISGFAVGVARATGIGYIKLIAVRPESRRKGVASVLLDSVEQTLAERSCSVIRLFESAPNYFMPGLDPRYTEAKLLFEQRGYSRFGETYNLIADLRSRSFETKTEEATLLEQGITVRRAEEKDRAAVSDFLDLHWPAWQTEVSATFNNTPISLHLALRDRSVLGFSAFEGNNRGLGWFGPMGTAEAARGLGIGGILLRRCLADMKAAGHAEAVIPWVGPVRFYSNTVDARISRVFHRYEKAAPINDPEESQ